MQFVRPVHGLILLHGEHVVPGEVLGLQERQQTRSATVSSKMAITITSADEPPNCRNQPARSLASFASDVATIGANPRRRRCAGARSTRRWLPDEVTALVEWPVIYVRRVRVRIPEVPQECLILTMQQNQKYFPLLDAAGKLQTSS